MKNPDYYNGKMREGEHEEWMDWQTGEAGPYHTQ
jgi:hypothetical protein